MVPLLSLTDIRAALLKAEELLPQYVREIAECLQMFHEVIAFHPGDLVEYQKKDGDWVPGVVVAYMVCEPRYICTPGDEREKATDPLLACPRKYVRQRGGPQ
jgi:hypothetical protein